jgi:short subunit fatty acids transporter
MNFDSPIVAIIAFALAGLGVGFGLVIGAFVARALRRYMTDEGLNGKS